MRIKNFPFTNLLLINIVNSILTKFVLVIFFSILNSSFIPSHNLISLKGQKEYCKKKQKPLIVLSKAYSEKIIPGRPNQAIETKYSFEVILKKEDIKFDSIWINNSVFPIVISTKSISVSPKGNKYHKGDTITLNAFELEGSNTIINPITPPKKIKGVALIRYIYMNQKEYFTVLTLDKRKSIIHQ